MGPTKSIALAFVLALGVPLAVSTAACGGAAASGVKHAAVQAGDMPESGEWTGVYYSQTYGYLHIIKETNHINGRWRTTAGDRWGELAGTVTGDLLRYEWTEHIIGQVGTAATRHGKGYFRYTEPKKGEAHELRGEWGLDEDEVGETWNAVKQKDKMPDFASIVPDETEVHGHGGGWDDAPAAPTASGEPEAPPAE